MFIALFIIAKWKQSQQVFFKKRSSKNLLVIQWSRLCVFSAGGWGSIPGQGSSMPHSAAKKNNNNNLPHNEILLRKKRVKYVKPCKSKDES